MESPDLTRHHLIEPGIDCLYLATFLTGEEVCWSRRKTPRKIPVVEPLKKILAVARKKGAVFCQSYRKNC